MSFTVDSYSEDNYDSHFSIGGGSWQEYLSQSFTGQAGTLASYRLYLAKFGTVSGNITAYLYTHTGTYGTSSKPGTLLATSNVVDITTLSTSFALVDFTFPVGEQYTLTGDYYCLVLHYNGALPSNSLRVGSDNSTPTHSGNAAYSDDAVSWTVSAAEVCFYVFGEAGFVPKITVL